ncbi:MAG: Adenylate cyclase 1 [bacterium ADurb.Bin236]|nr:MAG: Adenylate cyclase 1 [bacterium ADurb.Bin236]HPN94792.1 adenylate/guanylate cyclase domain-containing protein [bacterium]
MDNTNSIVNVSDSRRWALILFEVAFCYVIIYVSALQDWPKHEYYRFLVLFPLYQFGVVFGYIGGVIGSIVTTLLFLPLIPLDPSIAKDSTTEYPSVAGMIIFFNLFGVFIGGVIGKGRKTHKELSLLSIVSDNIAKETNERAVMLQLMKESMALLEAECAAVLIRIDADNDPASWTMLGINRHMANEAAIATFAPSHPLVWAAKNNKRLATNGAGLDERFEPHAVIGRLKSVMVFPVAFKNDVNGALMVAGRKSGETYSENDMTLVSFLADTAGDTIFNMAQERKRQMEKMREERMKELFSRFVSTSVAEYVLGNPDLMKGQWREVTALVSDIRDFTSISERLTPRQVVEQLNEYFTAIVDVIFEKKGTIDKYIGDCVIAYWGAPLPDDDHAIHAAEAAVNIIAEIESLNRKWKSAGKPLFNAGIALHTCPVLMSSLGDERRRVFTIMGKEVEKVVSIESLTKTHKTKIIATKATADLISSRFAINKLPELEMVKYGDLFEIPIPGGCATQ